jgi:YHS domain-containing protein
MKYLLGLGAMAVLMAGCSSAPQSSSATDQSWKGDYRKWGKDPVGGIMILKSTAVAQRDYQGVTYYFQAAEESQKFDSNPAYYAKAAQDNSSQHPTNSKVR